MAMVKISVTVEEKTLEDARRRVGTRELSAYINDAVAAENRRRAGFEALAALDREYGPIRDDHPATIKAKELWQEAMSFSTRVRSRQQPKGKRSRAKSTAKP